MGIAAAGRGSMSGAAIINQVRRSLGPGWAVLPCAGREAARGLAALIFREGTAHGWRAPPGEGGAQVRARIMRMAGGEGRDLEREIGRGFDLLLERGIVRWDADGLVSFSLAPLGRRPRRSQPGREAEA